jgi:hypothetical protein
LLPRNMAEKQHSRHNPSVGVKQCGLILVFAGSGSHCRESKKMSVAGFVGP